MNRNINVFNLLSFSINPNIFYKMGEICIVCNKCYARHDCSDDSNSGAVTDAGSIASKLDGF